MKLAKITTLLLSCLVMSPAALALRCGSELVQEGDHVIDVQRACGDPVFAEQWLEQMPVLYRPHVLLPYRQEWQAVSVRLWTYNFGPRKFMQVIRFENGRVVEVEGLRKGFIE